MYSYSYLGMLSRTILAALHFNYNIERAPKTDQNGNVKLRVSYVKYKYGEGTVREVKTAQNYEYVKDIYKNLIETPRDHLRVLKIELEAEVPEAMNTMNEKENKHEAIRKYMERKEAQTLLCPPTCTDTELEELVAPPPERGTRKVPICKSCDKPMKGHKIINKKRYCPHQLPVEN
ncbi:uncharacterized protein LOC110246675 [Exaiptasia diaphana]|uniref:Uncharacterized protein n=1 Tax=Exaiptasia diaphana TaxID=2652724 RepID=A0A913XRT8_EXADI|nr:uncharacterized protein LOC110246675 [Exaiptasia diaphana]